MKSQTKLILVGIVIILISLIIFKNIGVRNDDTHMLKKPFISTIEEKLTISSSLYPATQIDVKSPISGIVEKIFLRPGENVEIGDEILQIKLIPDASRVEIARSNLDEANVNFIKESKSFDRYKKLYDKKLIAPAEFEEYQRTYLISKQRVQTAGIQLTLIKKGYARGSEVSNIVRATTNGTIIDLPLKIGASIIERNNFNEGTTVATIAQMDSFILKGKVNESDLAHLSVGMPIKIMFTAYRDISRKAFINKISSLGITEQGVMKYYIEALVNLKNDSLTVRPGYTANAEVIMRRKQNALAIEEKYIQFRNDTPFVMVFKKGITEQRILTTGLSDGVNIEILKGLKKDEVFKVELNSTSP